MRIESSVTSISWIPSEAIDGMPKLPFEIGIGHYDPPPPDSLSAGDLARLRDEDRYREANELKAWIDVEDGVIVGHGYDGGGYVGSTTFRFGVKDVIVPGVAFEILRAEPDVRGDSVRFVQTVGGRAGFPAPRRVKQKPFMRIHSATAWTTLALTIHADGASEHELVGASKFPRHWIYDADGQLVGKSGIVDFKAWYREAHGDHTPWGDEESDVFVAQAESALEREISGSVMRPEAKPARRVVESGTVLVEQGETGTDVYLLLDGIFGVEINGEEVAELGPGAIVGERASFEHGERTATVRAKTRSRVAIVSPDMLDRGSLERLAATRAVT